VSSFAAKSSAFTHRASLLAAAVILLTAVGGLLEPLLAINRHIPRDYNEGWNAYWQQTAIQGGELYPPASSTVVNNYPPLSFYVVGFAGERIHDNIVAGRWIALASLFAIATNLALWLRFTGSSPFTATLGAAMFIAALVSYAPDYVAMNDPQLLAHAVMTTALVVLWRWRFSNSAAIAAALLMLLAGFVKHLLIPIPLATGAYLLWRARRCFEVWFIAMAAGLMVGFSLAWLAYGSSFFTALNLARVYESRQALWETFKTLVMFSPLLVPVVIVAWLHFSNPERRTAERELFATLYIVIAGASGLLAAGGAGVDKNAFFDLLIAACLGAALAIEALASRPYSVRALLALLCIAFVAAAGIRFPGQYTLVRSVHVREREASQDMALITRVGAHRVACETLALCYWAKLPFELDFFSYGQKLAKDVLPASSCTALFGSDRINVVQIAADSERNTVGSDLLPAACNTVLGNRFKRVRESVFGDFRLRNDLQSTVVAGRR